MSDIDAAPDLPTLSAAQGKAARRHHGVSNSRDCRTTLCELDADTNRVANALQGNRRQARPAHRLSSARQRHLLSCCSVAMKANV